MIAVATFDILPTDDLFPEIFTQLPEEDAYTDKFDRLNYGSVFCIMNLGTMLVIFLTYLLLYLIYALVTFVGKALCCKKRANRLRSYLSAMLFWNHAIVFL